jgi:hypothetical protein
MQADRHCQPPERFTMKLVLRASCALWLVVAGTAFAQLPSGKAAGVATGYIHLAVTDVAQAKAISCDSEKDCVAVREKMCQ